MKRRPGPNDSPAFKAKAAQAASKRDKTMSGSATQFDLHPSRIEQCKLRILDGVTAVFANTPKARDEQSIGDASLHAGIGRLRVCGHSA